MLTVILTSLNIVVYYLRRLSERSSDLRSTSSQCQQFSLDEIRSTTDNFHQEYLIGSGGYGKVYKGRVGSNGGTVVAIKRLKPESRQGENEFWTEIEMLSKLQHDNLVSLIGYCNESQELLLIYQYMKRGTLDDHLYKIASKGIFHPPLTWERRLKLSVGAASGLWYLHEQQVIHRDVKSSNILIDGNWVAKISDFGLSKMGPAVESLLSHVSTDVKSAFGYLCPEYFQTRMLSFKSDVYAFGVVLLEVLTGRPPVDMQLPDEQPSLVAWARNCIKNGDVDGIIDPTLLRQIAPACLTKYVEIAQRCLKRVPRERPSMFDVVRHLESALVLQQSPDSDEVISRSAKPGSEEKDLNSNVPSRKWWNFFRYFQKSPKNFQKSPKNFHRSLKAQHGYGNFSFNEMIVATNNFSNSIGVNFRGSETICKGQVEEGKRVVVLRSYFKEGSYYKEKPLPTMQELKSILGISPSGKHAPPASLMGYYVDKHNVILMFADIDVSNRSLRDHLCNPVSEPLSWKQRLIICIDAARVLKCLMAVKIQFWNLTSEDILLDESFVTKIDMYSGASKISRDNGAIVDSYYIRDETTRKKSVVFSFGRILFEVLCADEASTDLFEKDSKNYIQHFDPYLVGKISAESSKIYIEMTSRCLHHLGRERPSMSEIVSMLEMALQLQEDTSDNHDI